MMESFGSLAQTVELAEGGKASHLPESRVTSYAEGSSLDKGGRNEPGAESLEAVEGNRSDDDQAERESGRQDRLPLGRDHFTARRSRCRRSRATCARDCCGRGQGG